jgi:hypothetical protein
MIDLDLMQYKSELKFKSVDGQTILFDPIRKKWLVLQPEELVRQLLLVYLIEEKGYTKNRINVEKEIKVNRMQKRCDILIFDSDTEPFLLVECKAPNVPVSQDVFKQIAWYNMALRVKYLLVSNGMQTYCCSMDYEEESFKFLEDIPVPTD